MTKTTIPVTKRALLQRINRKLKASGQHVLATRGTAARREVGEFYQVNVDRNSHVASHVNLERLGRELEVLAPWERLAD
jgi:hypothetical protein